MSAILVGSSESEKLQGFESDDTITGNGGPDLFPLTAGDDVITDFNPAEDMIDVGDFARESDDFAVLTSLEAIAANSTQSMVDGEKALVIDVDGELGDSTTTLIGVTIDDLTVSNVFFGLTGESIPPLMFTHIPETTVTLNDGTVASFPGHDLSVHPLLFELVSGSQESVDVLNGIGSGDADEADPEDGTGDDERTDEGDDEDAGDGEEPESGNTQDISPVTVDSDDDGDSVALDEPRRFHNSMQPTDVNADSLTSAIDALIIINHLNSSDEGRLVLAIAASLFADVNDDGQISAVDALRVINKLNGAGEGSEGESSTDPNGDGDDVMWEYIPPGVAESATRFAEHGDSTEDVAVAQPSSFQALTLSLGVPRPARPEASAEDEVDAVLSSEGWSDFEELLDALSEDH